MDLHANAVLTVRQRQRVCDLVACRSDDHRGRARRRLLAGRRRRSGSTGDVEASRCATARAGRSARRGARRRAVEQAILRAREELREGPHVIGWALGVAASTVHAVLRRHGRSRLVAATAARGDRPLRALRAR